VREEFVSRLWNRYHACMETIPTGSDHAKVRISGRSGPHIESLSGEH